MTACVAEGEMATFTEPISGEISWLTFQLFAQLTQETKGLLPIQDCTGDKDGTVNAIFEQFERTFVWPCCQPATTQSK